MVRNGAVNGKRTTLCVCHALNPSGTDRTGQINDDSVLACFFLDRQTLAEALIT